MKTILKLECPYCSAPLEYEEGKEQMYCQYCGKKILLIDENSYTFKHIDEAKIRESENNKTIRLKELDYEERIERKESRVKYFAYGIALIMFIAGLLTFEYSGFIGTFLVLGGLLIFHTTYFAIQDRQEEKRIRELNRAGLILTNGLSNYKECDYKEVYAKLKSLGFNSIILIPLHDLSFTNLWKNGKVESITVDSEPMVMNMPYPENGKVEIKYHSK